MDGMNLDALKYSTMKNVSTASFSLIADEYIRQCEKYIWSRKNLSIDKLKSVLSDIQGFWNENKRYGNDTDFQKVDLFFDKCIVSNNRWVLQYAAILSFACARHYFLKLQNNLSKDDKYFVSRSLLTLILTEDNFYLPDEVNTIRNVALLCENFPGEIHFTKLISLPKKEKNINVFFETIQRIHLVRNGITAVNPKKISLPKDVENHHKFWEGFNIEDSPILLQKISPDTLDKFIELGFDDFKNPELLNECSEYNYKLSTIERLFLYQNTPADQQIQHLIKYETHKPCSHFMRLVVLAVTSGGDVNATNHHNETLLLNAGFAKDQKLFNWLLDNGANPNIITRDGDCAATEFPQYISDHQSKKIKKSLRGIKGCETQTKVRKM